MPRFPFLIPYARNHMHDKAPWNKKMSTELRQMKYLRCWDPKNFSTSWTRHFTSWLLEHSFLLWLSKFTPCPPCTFIISTATCNMVRKATVNWAQPAIKGCTTLLLMMIAMIMGTVVRRRARLSRVMSFFPDPVACCRVLPLAFATITTNNTHIF